MNKATQLRYNMESLCIYQFKTDPVMHSLLHLLRRLWNRYRIFRF